MSGFIPPKIFRIITKHAPIVSNDILLRFKGKYLLLKRKNEPAKGLWWTPGGRVYKNERIMDSVRRVIKEELGIKKIKIKKLLGIFESFCTPGKFRQKDIFYISFGFLVEPVGHFKIKMDSQHSEYKFFSKPPKKTHPFIKKLFYLSKREILALLYPIVIK
jgi:colanic acid biosynthesis protein WcaH